MKPQTQRAGRPIVLHLTGTASQHCEPYNHAIVDAGAACVQVHTVYEALARTLKPREQGSVDLVLVCVDCVADSEREFFELVHRWRPEVGTYVYASGSDESRAQQLVDWHLASRAAPSDIGSLVGACRSYGQAEPGADREPTSPPAAEQASAPERLAEPSTVAKQQPADERPSEAPGKHDEVSRPPTRRPPQPPDPQKLEERPDALLTQEELAALLGRDDGANSRERKP